jgi:hypothetical protein
MPAVLGLNLRDARISKLATSTHITYRLDAGDRFRNWPGFTLEREHLRVAVARNDMITCRLVDRTQPKDGGVLVLTPEDLREALEEVDTLASGAPTTEIALGIADLED